MLVMFFHYPIQLFFNQLVLKKSRIRQGKQYYEVEWRQYDLPSTQALEDQMNNLSLIVLDDDDEEKLISIEPADLFRHAYPDVVNAFEAPVPKTKKPKKNPIIKKKRPKQISTTVPMSTSMSLDLLSMMHDETYEVPITKNKICKFNHRPTMAALSTSINIDVLDVIQKSNGNINLLKKAKSRPIKHKTQSDMIIHTQKPVTLLNTSLSLDVLDIVLRGQQQLNDDDECVIINKSSSDDKDVLPLPRTAV